MARRDEQQRGFFGRWWANQSDRHYQIITNISILSAALLVWGIIFLFVLSGASDPSKENLVALTWIGMVVGGIGTFYVAPEFFYYSGQKQLLDDILLLDSRAEVLRRRKEGEDAAIMLGSRYMRLMRGLLEMHQIPVGKNLSLISLSCFLQKNSLGAKYKCLPPECCQEKNHPMLVPDHWIEIPFHPSD